MKKYTKIGIGNTWFVRTEIEHDDGSESEMKGFIKPFKMKSAYIRVWLGMNVMIIDSKEGMKFSKKDRRKFKLMIGFSGL
ncbi:DUF3977 family protein [Paenibacillus sp. An7]|uniref:DUF3977 family protein n=1 Tax=Paenibacillus sp. An7 TaxID=2689577 RepID=UPI0013580F9F|nr:DUF3977 family protein [Paenibacillus sp. An7]